MIGTIITGVVMAALAPLVAYSINLVNDKRLKAKALADIKAAPHIHVGAVYDRIINAAGDCELVGLCHVTSIAFGRIEVELLDDDSEGMSMNWTNEEFKTLHPVYVPDRVLRDNALEAEAEEAEDDESVE